MMPIALAGPVGVTLTSKMSENAIADCRATPPLDEANPAMRPPPLAAAQRAGVTRRADGRFNVSLGA